MRSEYLEHDDPRECYDIDPNAEDRGYEAMRQGEMDIRLGAGRKAESK